MAWERLVRLYGPMVYSWCRHAGLQAEDASDIAQEVFHSVFQAMAAFRRDRPGDSFRAWLKTITRNKVRDLWRRRQREPSGRGGSDARRYFDAVPDSDVPDAADGPGEIGQLYGRALELLSAEFEPTTWDAFRWVTVDGRAPEEVASTLGISRNAVYIAKSRVLSRFRAMFAELVAES